jgi:hypothetical protein
LHLRLAGDQSGEHVVAEGEIGRGRRRPHAEYGHRADHDPERHRAKADLLAGMDEGIAVLTAGSRRDRRTASHRAARRRPGVVMRMVLGIPE